ncbi:SHOCT domain-containing protein [Haloferacaceae archaeon DSL9]
MQPSQKLWALFGGAAAVALTAVFGFIGLVVTLGLDTAIEISIWSGMIVLVVFVMALIVAEEFVKEPDPTPTRYEKVSEMADAVLDSFYRDITGKDPNATPDDPEAREDALDTLRGRYARDELTDAEFERKLDRLLRTETVDDARAYTAGKPEKDAPSRRATRELETERDAAN